jgi:deoxyribodipyrimidine photo-lyase
MYASRVTYSRVLSGPIPEFFTVRCWERIVTTAAVWHRADLRTPDNAALVAAAESAGEAGTVVPVFVVDPRYYGADGLACDARLRFLHECLLDLRRQYRDLGTDLLLLQGDPRERLRALLDGPVDEVHYNRHPTARHGRQVADTVREWPETVAHADDGIRYGPRDPDGTVRTDTREGWDTQAEAYFEADPHPRPESLAGHGVEGDTTVEAVEAEFGVDPDKREVPEGGTVAGNERLSAFVEGIQAYPGSVAPPAAAEDGCSRLSPYLAFGALSPRQVYGRLQAAAPDCRGREMLVSRLYWNRHYHQKLADWPGWTTRSVNPVFRGLFRERHDPDLDRAWREGETGFPLVDAAMRALRQTGYINFRLRALVSTFYVYVLKQWWRRGADYMYEQLIDADAAINYTQWQSQCNLTGVHPVRVYDPAKQIREYDPDGEYIRRYVPELADLPDEHLPRPERAPESVQADCGVDVGTDYPYPVVEYDHEAAQARELYADLADRAREAIRPGSRAWRRASLSGARRERLTGAEEAGGQASLDDF